MAMRIPAEMEFEGKKFDHETHEIDETHERSITTGNRKPLFVYFEPFVYFVFHFHQATHKR